MNERIKELETQAWDYAYDHETVKGKVAFDGFINANFSDEFSKKFAELIVRECYLWAKENGGLGCEEDFEALKEHFGVE